MVETHDDNPALFDDDENDHRAVYIFNPSPQNATSPQQEKSRPTKRRKVTGGGGSGSKRVATGGGHAEEEAHDAPMKAAAFPQLFDGKESAEAAGLRKKVFDTAWPVLDGRIKNVLRGANRTTLEDVSSFIRDAEGDATRGTRIPAGFIIIGPNIASQDLLFEQLSEALGKATQARFVRLRAAGAPNLKAALKKVIRDATAQVSVEGDGDEDDTEVAFGRDGRKYLDYDLEGLHAFLGAQQNSSRRVIVAFEDSEAFESSLLTDLLALFHSWQGRIQFSVLFGIATSVELFQARLLKSTARQLFGAKFDVVQADLVLDNVFKSAIAGTHATLRLGPNLLRSLLERQRDQVAGIRVFISSIKYAYMCHFYANPLSVLLADEKSLTRQLLQPEHIQAVRTLDSFKSHVEASVDARQLNHAQSLVEDDSYLVKQMVEQRQKKQDYLLQLLRSLHLLTSMNLIPGRFTDLYVSALSGGLDLTPTIDAIKRLGADDVPLLINRLLLAIQTGSPDLDLPGWEDSAEDLTTSLTEIRDEIEALVLQAREKGQQSLKSKISAQSKVLRTTVVAQKVQLSQDTAKLTDEDKAFGKAIDALVDLLTQNIYSPAIDSLFLHEAWAYDSMAPYRDVFVPRPGTAFERALTRPGGYLGCECCCGKGKAGGGQNGTRTLSATQPTTCILYQLYLETGSLVNVADLWSAYYALVGEDSRDTGGLGLGEREALVRFYRGLAELRLMGFVKQSKKKADHVAKVKWLL
ncbi:origin recognition complex subunit 3 N-terminus-domain-containing protein [Sordaria brevicollis]|uniref:Origin recognition complex subunit 3 N-terminus-domain-containing protein n=1 Tax=Sordaria brevicollis TaxID=83679 RepID=A0AAE0PAZ5_SORBR|nr:origin recognition complex subunit 3 N-terminus-domain-containing protein [Sordaria brevicollis]